ncbi:MAG: LamB/YcsF family protein [Haliscomenobacter sp.]
MLPMEIDINCDLGESYGHFQIGADEQVFPYISSCNIACGFHGGDPLHIERTIERALSQGVRIGAHPSYPDLGGFGRRYMQIPQDELRALIKYQVAALKGMAESAGGTLAYVKAHGALYNRAADDPAEARALLDAVWEIDPELALMGLAGSLLEQMATEEKRPFIPEGFADRRYSETGRLLPRTRPDALLSTPEEAAAQACRLVLEKGVVCDTGAFVPVRVQSICVHGDHPAAPRVLQAIEAAFLHAGIQRKPIEPKNTYIYDRA